MGKTKSKAKSTTKKKSHKSAKPGGIYLTNSTRSETRAIFDVLIYVKRNRDFFYGINTPKKYSLEKAAAMVGLPKKTLDDYLHQLKFAYKFGFPLKKFMTDKMDSLREHNSKIRKCCLVKKK